MIYLIHKVNIIISISFTKCLLHLYTFTLFFIIFLILGFSPQFIISYFEVYSLDHRIRICCTKALHLFSQKISHLMFESLFAGNNCVVQH